MKIKQAIEKAIEGGWNSEECFVIGSRRKFNIDRMVLDPNFWKCLGKAMRWQNRKYQSSKSFLGHQEWIYNWHKLIDHLAEGETIESYFEQLKT